MRVKKILAGLEIKWQRIFSVGSVFLLFGILVHPLMAGGHIIDDMEDVSDWFVHVGQNAGPGHVTIDNKYVKEGDFSGKFHYEHTAARGFDFINFSRDISPTDFRDEVITLWLKQPHDPDFSLSLMLYDPSGRYKQYYFPEGNDTWERYQIKNSDLVWDGDLSNVVKIVIHSNGDASSTPTSGCFYIDDIKVVPVSDIAEQEKKLRLETELWIASLLGKKDILRKKGKVQFVSWGGIGSKARAEAAARIGIDTHRIPIDWPGEEEASLPLVDSGGRKATLAEVVRWVDDAGMRVIIHFYNHGVPDWFWKKFPEAQTRNFQGKTYYHIDFWHPAGLEYIARNMAQIIDYLSEVGLLDKIDGVEIGIGMEGQLSYWWGDIWAFSKYTISAYRDFLKKRYGGSLSKLNHDWGTNHKGFSQILPPTDYKDDREHQVFQEFYRDTLLRAATILAEGIKKKMSPKIWLWLAHNIKYPEKFFAARHPVFYMENLKKLGRTVAITSVVPGWQTKKSIERMKKYATVIGEWYITPTPAQQRVNAKLAQEMGCDGFFVGVLENLFEADGTPTPAGKETAVIIREWKEGKTIGREPIF